MINRFLYFEDYQVGMKGLTVPRTVTECDIVTFACQTGDYSQMHMDRHYAANLAYGDRIAHGLLGASFAIGGLSTHAPHILGRENPNAWLQDFAVDYRDVIRVGDTIKTEWHVTDKLTDPDVAGLHSVKTSLRVFNQDSNLVAEGLVTIRIADKHANPAEMISRPGEPWTATQFASDTNQVLLELLFAEVWVKLEVGSPFWRNI